MAGEKEILLEYLELNPGQRLGEIVEGTQLSHGRVATWLSRLYQDGLIDRKMAKNGHRVNLYAPLGYFSDNGGSKEEEIPVDLNEILNPEPFISRDRMSIGEARKRRNKVFLEATEKGRFAFAEAYVCWQEKKYREMMVALSRVDRALKTIREIIAEVET